MNSSPTLGALQRRIAEMQPVRLDDRALPTASGLRALLPGGTLRQGASYAVHGSRQLALAFLAEVSASGAWCGVIGCDSFGAEAAADLGIALDRCILVPQPGANAVGLAGSLAEVLSVVLIEPPGRVRPGDAERIAARLREHGSALVSLGEWPGSETDLRVLSSRWMGLGAGHGVLHERELTVQSRDRRGVRRHRVRFSEGAIAEPGAQEPRTTPPLVPL